MENNNIIPMKGTYITSVVTFIVSTLVFLAIAYFGVESLRIKLSGGGPEALAFIFLIPLLIIGGIVLLVPTTIGTISNIKCITGKYCKKTSIVFLAINSLYVLLYIVCMVILFI